MTALFQHQSGFHTADTGADDRHLLGMLGGHDLVLVVLHGAGRQGAASQMQGILQALGVGRTLALSEAEASVVAVDAGLDLLFAAVHQLGDPLGIDQILTSRTHTVDLTGSDLGGSHIGGHLTGADHGLAGKVLDVLHLGQVAVLGHINRGMCPVPGVVSTVIAVKHIVSGFLQILDGALGFFHIAAELHKFLTGHGAFAPALGLGHHGVTQCHGEILTALALDSLHDLHGEAIAILERAAVLVGTEVPVLHGKLIQQIAFMHGMDLHTVNAGVLAHLGGLGESLHHLLDLLAGQGAGGVILLPAVGGFRAGSAAVFHIQEGACHLTHGLVPEQHDHHVVDGHGAAEAGGQLHEQLGTGLVELGHPLSQVLEHFLVLIQPAFTHGVAHALHTGQYQAHVFLGTVENMVRSFLVKMAGLQPAKQGCTAHRGLHDAVFNLHIADLPRRKEGLILFVHHKRASFVIFTEFFLHPLSATGAYSHISLYLIFLRQSRKRQCFPHDSFSATAVLPALPVNSPTIAAPKINTAPIIPQTDMDSCRISADRTSAVTGSR